MDLLDEDLATFLQDYDIELGEREYAWEILRNDRSISLYEALRRSELRRGPRPDQSYDDHVAVVRDLRRRASEDSIVVPTVRRTSRAVTYEAMLSSASSIDDMLDQPRTEAISVRSPVYMDEDRELFLVLEADDDLYRFHAHGDVTDVIAGLDGKHVPDTVVFATLDGYLHDVGYV
jgi:hypothetical protein